MIREVKEIYRFYKHQTKENRSIMFYAERSSDIAYVEKLISILANNYKGRFVYVTSDPNDPILEEGQAFPAFYSNKLLSILMMLLDSKVCIMTMPDLDIFNIKRSLVAKVHYVYVFHSLISTHMGYLENSFDHYDSILCVGEYQKKEIQKREKMVSLTPKVLVDYGYERLESIYSNYQDQIKRLSSQNKSKKTILIAPSWGEMNILECLGKELVQKLHEKYNLVIRPHPEYIKRSHKQYEELNEFLSHFSNVRMDTNIKSENSLLESDLLITDFSGIGFEFSLGTERPVLYIDCNKKVRNPNYKNLGLTPIELSYRDLVGKVVTPSLGEIVEGIEELFEKKVEFKEQIRSFRNEHVYNFESSVTAGLNHIKSVMKAD